MINCRYANMIALLPIIDQMVASGVSSRQIEDELSLEGDRPVHNLLKRQRRKAAKGVPKFQGHQPAKTLQKDKNKRLKMENELLRGFCSPWKECEAEGQICSHSSSQR